MHTEHTNSIDASNNELKQVTQIIFLATILKIFELPSIINWAMYKMYQCTCDFFVKLCTCGQWNICVHVTIFDLPHTLYIIYQKPRKRNFLYKLKNRNTIFDGKFTF